MIVVDNKPFLWTVACFGTLFFAVAHFMADCVLFFSEIF